MNLPRHKAPHHAASAADARFADERLIVALSDGRELSVPYKKIARLRWLAKAAPKQRAHWSLEPGGNAIYRDDRDDGIEICHLLAMESLNCFSHDRTRHHA
ncbi:MAG: DUF2442 domain-containing protein [Limisphaerales bacterium]